MLFVNGNSDTRRAPYRAERDHARRAFADRDVTDGWHHLERAHVLAQPEIIIHISSHIAMLHRGAIERDAREILGPALRALLAGPASLTGRIPTENDGRARTPPSERMTIPPTSSPTSAALTTQRNDTSASSTPISPGCCSRSNRS